MIKNLTMKEQKFVEECVATLNLAEAARRAYNLGSKGGSRTKEQECTTASVIAHENLKKPKIKNALDKVMKELKITREDRMKRMAQILWDKNSDASINASKEIGRISGDNPDKNDESGFLETLKKLYE